MAMRLQKPHGVTLRQLPSDSRRPERQWPPARPSSASPALSSASLRGRGALGSIARVPDGQLTAAGRKKHAAEFLDLGKQLALRGKHVLAVAQFSEVVAFCPSEPKAYVLRGLSMRAIGDHERAVHDFTMAIRLQPTVAAHYSARATSLAALRLHDTVPGAIRDLTSAVSRAEATVHQPRVAAVSATRDRHATRERH